MSKNKKQTNNISLDGYSFRTFKVRNQEGRLSAIAATDAPVDMYDFNRMEIIPEVLRLERFDIPDSFPLLDSHNRDRANDVLGTAHNQGVTNGELLVELSLSATEPQIKTKIEEKHLTDLSIGYIVDESVHIPAGQSEKIAGQMYEGPLNVAVSGRVFEVSLTPVGADSAAKIRKRFSHYGDLMDKDTNKAEPQEKVETQAAAKKETRKRRARKSERIEPKPEPKVDVTAEVTKALKEQRERFAAIRNDAKRLGLSEVADELCDTCDSVEQAREKLIDLAAERQEKVPSRDVTITMGKSHDEKQSAAMRSALYARCGIKEEKRAEGWEDYRHANLTDIAEACLETAGERTRGLSRIDVAQRALQLSARSGGYLQTGDFANILLDASHKTLQQSYAEANPTWQQVFRQGSSVADFKNKNSVRLSEVPTLDMWDGVNDPEQLSLSDAKEAYAVEAYSDDISFGWKAIVNDDLGAFTRVPHLMGRAAARTVNATAWAVITANAAMSDGVALFASGHSNLAGSAALPDSTSMNSARASFRTQTGMNGAILGLSPKYFVVPAALETTAKQIVGSEFAYDATAQNTSRLNTYGNLIPVVEPLLDSNSTTAWYLMADPADIDTVEVSFLQGYETPQIRSYIKESDLSVHYVITHAFGAKALDHRGMFKNAGS